MPRKTRKEKISAHLHRKQNPSTTGLSPASYTFSSSAPAISSPVPVTAAALHESDYRYVRHDLVRIALFTCLAFLANGVLYFLSHRG